MEFCQLFSVSVSCRYRHGPMSKVVRILSDVRHPLRVTWPILHVQKEGDLFQIVLRSIHFHCNNISIRIHSNLKNFIQYLKHGIDNTFSFVQFFIIPIVHIRLQIYTVTPLWNTYTCKKTMFRNERNVRIGIKKLWLEFSIMILMHEKINIVILIIIKNDTKST